MKNKKLILLISLTILALLSLLYGIFTPSKLRRQISSQADLSQERPAKPLPPLALAERPLRRSDDPSWGRNPFLPKGVSASVPEQLILDGIVWDEKNPRAVINGRIVGIGAEAGGARVVQIKKDRVILSEGAGDFEIRLGRRK